MKNFYLIAILFATALTHAQIVTIPDANFKNALVNTPCIDTNGDGIGDSDADLNNDGEIQVSEAEAVLWLGGINNNIIASLEGIQSFTNLEYLACGSNPLTSLDVTQNLSLKYLDCNSNSLTSLDVSQNINLEYLDCGNNLLTSLDVSQNSNLIHLKCYMNLLTSLDVTQNLNITTLWCGVNSISDLDVTQNSDLVILYCEANLLTNLDVTQNPSLKEITCFYSSISSLDVSQNPNLEGLWCFGTSITSLDVSQNPNLELLWCNENPQLTSLNVKNGNNVNMTLMFAQSNPNLNCIQVDDENAIYPGCEIDSGWCKDSTTIYNENCSLALEENIALTFTMFPNPAQNVLNILSNEIVESIKIYSIEGQLIKEVSSFLVDVSSLAKGLYFAQVSIEGKTLTKKFIKS